MHVLAFSVSVAGQQCPRRRGRCTVHSDSTAPSVSSSSNYVDDVVLTGLSITFPRKISPLADIHEF
jgi:hypothetical protein